VIGFHDQPGGGLGQDPVPKDFTPAGCARCEFPHVKRPLDSANYFAVSAQGEQFGIMKMPVRWLARDEAINLAAWLVATADPTRKQFDRVFKEIAKI
jgi:hypothetical protein